MMRLHPSAERGQVALKKNDDVRGATLLTLARARRKNGVDRTCVQALQVASWGGPHTLIISS